MALHGLGEGDVEAERLDLPSRGSESRLPPRPSLRRDCDSPDRVKNGNDGINVDIFEYGFRPSRCEAGNGCSYRMPMSISPFLAKGGR